MERINIFAPMRLVRLALPLFLIMLFTFSGCKQGGSQQASFADIENGFKNIPDTVQTSIYWYWISDNISKEGVVKDLEAQAFLVVRNTIQRSAIRMGDLLCGKKYFLQQGVDVALAGKRRADCVELLEPLEDRGSHLAGCRDI